MKHIAYHHPKKQQPHDRKFSKKVLFHCFLSFVNRPLYCSDDIDCGEQLPVPDKAKPDAVKKLAATALYIHFCNRVCTTRKCNVYACCLLLLIMK